MSGLKQKTFEQWYKEEYDPNGYLYPSAPLNIGFQDYCARVDEYLQYLANDVITGEKQCNLPVVSGSASDFYTDLMKLINSYCDKGLKKPDLVNKMEYATESCKLS